VSSVAVVVSLAAPTPAEVLRRVPAAAVGADWLELRLDALPGAWLAERVRDPAPLAELLRAARELARRPLLVACHGPEAFGAFRGDAAELRSLLRTASTVAQWIDVPSALAEGFDSVAARRVLSEHHGHLSAAELAARLRELARRAGRADRFKLVPTTASGLAGVELLEVLRRCGDPRAICFGAGPHGSFTRALAPLFGSAAVYAAPPPEVGQPTAPGQWTAAALRDRWPAAGCGPATRALAVVGGAVARSASPAVHTAAQRALSLEAVFVAVDLEDFAAAVPCFEAGETWAGLAVTAPHKVAALAAARECEPAAAECGAANTWVRRAAGGFCASNTDALALSHLARDLAPRARRALVWGAGGAARAAVVALRSQGLELTLAARRAEAAAQLVAPGRGAVLPFEGAGTAEADLWVQTTPLGGASAPDAMPPAPDPWPRAAALIEANYTAGPTPLVRRARAAGAPVADGRRWFLAQAAAQFTLFHGRAPDAEAMAAVFDAWTGVPER
jgi:shikimate dehydrogenase